MAATPSRLTSKTVSKLDIEYTNRHADTEGGTEVDTEAAPETGTEAETEGGTETGTEVGTEVETEDHSEMCDPTTCVEDDGFTDVLHDWKEHLAAQKSELEKYFQK